MSMHLGSSKIGKINIVSHDFTEGYNSGFEQGYAEGYKQGFNADRITFILEDEAFVVPEGTTWSDFINNIYNGANRITIDDQGLVYYNNTKVVIGYSNSSVRGSDLIKAGGNYEKYDPWGGGYIDPDGWT